MNSNAAVSSDDKAVATACARAALAGIQAVASHDDRGRRTLILSRGSWTREVLIEHLADALAEARAQQQVETTS